MENVKRYFYLLSGTFIVAAIWATFFLEIKIDTEAVPTLVNGLTSSLSVIVGFTGAIVGILYREAKSDLKAKRFFIVAILVLMIPLTTLWGTYTYLTMGKDMYQLAVKSALGGLISSLSIFSIVTLYTVISLNEEVANAPTP